MRETYEDITSRLGEPLWWDAHGVPRYDPFHPCMACEVYAQEVALLEIACQECGKIMRVSINRDKYSMRYGGGYGISLCDIITGYGVVPHYGDPPAHRGASGDDCKAGPTMNCEDLAVLEFWTRESFREWTRVPELEIRQTESEAS